MKYIILCLILFYMYQSYSLLIDSSIQILSLHIQDTVIQFKKNLFISLGINASKCCYNMWNETLNSFHNNNVCCMNNCDYFCCNCS